MSYKFFFQARLTIDTTRDESQNAIWKQNSLFKNIARASKMELREVIHITICIIPQYAGSNPDFQLAEPFQCHVSLHWVTLQAPWNQLAELSTRRASNLSKLALSRSFSSCLTALAQLFAQTLARLWAGRERDIENFSSVGSNIPYNVHVQ